MSAAGMAVLCSGMRWPGWSRTPTTRSAPQSAICSKPNGGCSVDMAALSSGLVLKSAFITPGGTVDEVLEQAEAAEASGWDGFFYWDAIDVGGGGLPIHDPWVLLAAVAMRTTRLRLS